MVHRVFMDWTDTLILAIPARKVDSSTSDTDQGESLAERNLSGFLLGTVVGGRTFSSHCGGTSYPATY